MGIKPNFTRDDIKARCDAFIEAVKKKEIERMMMLGEKCVIHAREVPPEIGFYDQTGNLRSSIGYAVFVDGVAVHSAYEQTLNGSTGVRAGQELAEKVGCTTTGVCLVVTAGMNYAVYVESGRYRIRRTIGDKGIADNACATHKQHIESSRQQR